VRWLEAGEEGKTLALGASVPSGEDVVEERKRKRHFAIGPCREGREEQQNLRQAGWVLLLLEGKGKAQPL